MLDFEQQTTGPEQALLRLPRRTWERDKGLSASMDFLVMEEPLEIRLGGVPLAVLMRTPGHDIELGVGFAVTERLVPDVSALARVAHCTTGENADNVLLLTPSRDVDYDLTELQRRLYSTSSCGICGKQSIERAMAEAPPLETSFELPASRLALLPDLLRVQQPVFGATGGLHAAALFDAGGELLVVREDIGRHNAVDKCVGWALGEGNVALGSSGLLVSGRISYEIVQKALAARIALVAGVGAVSALAAALARRANMTVVGFTHRERLCVYAGEERIT